MSVVRPQTPTDAFPMTNSNSGFFLALRLDEIVRAADEDATSRLWKLFNSCVNELEQGKRLENLSWRTWSRERTLYSRFSRVPILDDEPDSRSPALTEDEDDGDGDSSRDSSGSDDGSDDDQSRQERQQQQQNTNHLAPVPSETVVPPDVAEVTVTVTAAAALTAAAVPPFVVATAAQSTTGEQQQHPPLVATSNTSSNQSRQQHHNHHHHQCSASHPATASHPKLLANPPSRRHYSHSLPYTAAAAAAAAASASASPPIGQLIKRVIFNQSATMLTMTHSIDRPQHPPSLDLSNTAPKLHVATLSALGKAATPAPTPAPTPTAPSISASLGDRPTLTITESTPLPSVEPTPLPTPKPMGLSPFPYAVPAPLGCPDAQPQASDSHSAPVTTRRALNPSTGHYPISHHRMFYLQYHSPDGSSSGGSHNSHSHLTPPTPGLPPEQTPPQLPQMSSSHVEAHRARSNGTGATRMSARKGKDSIRHGHVTPRNMSGRITARIVHHHHPAGARKGIMSTKSDRSATNTLTPGSASSGGPRKAAAPRRLAETVEQREVDDEVGRVGMIGPDLLMQKQHQMQQVGRDTPQRQVQLSHQSRSEPGTSTFPTAASPAEAGNANPSSSQTAVQNIKVKNVSGPMMRLITPGLFDGDKVKPEVLDQRVDAALKAALNGATGNQRRRIKLVSSSEHESDDDDDDGESSWSDDESNEDERRHQNQQHQGPSHRSPPPSARRGSQTTESEDESDGDDEHDGPLARAAKEAERQRNMFAKLPRESYADLGRKRLGAGPSNLTLLLNPPPEMFPHEHPYRILSRHSRSAGDIAGDIAHHQHGGFGYGSQVEQPSHAHYQYQQQQQRGYGQPQQQLGPMQRQKSQPSYGHGQRPTQYAVAPPPQPRQRHMAPVHPQPQQQQAHPQQPNAKPLTRERVGGFGGFQFTVMHPVDPKAPKQPALAPAQVAQRPQQVAVAPPPSAAPRRASTGGSRVASTPPVLLRSLSKSTVLNPIIQQVTASSFKDAPPGRSLHSHDETELSPKRATVSPLSGRPGNRLSARPDDIELSDSEDEEPEQAIPSPKSMIKSPRSPTQEGGAKAQLEAVMSGKPKSAAASSVTVVTTEDVRFVDGQGPGAPIEFSESVVPLRAPPSTPSRGTETCVNGEHLPRSPTTVRAEHPPPHSTYGKLSNCHESPPPPYPEHAHAGVPSTSEPTCGNNNNTNAPIYPQPIEMPYPYNLPFPTHMLSPRTTRLKMLSSEMPPDLRNDLLWERKANRVHAVYRPMAGLRPFANATGSGDEGAPKEPTEEERAAMMADEARRRAMRNRTWAGVFPRPTAW